MASIDSLGLESWTGLRVEMEGRSVSLDRVQGRQLFARLRSLASRLSPGAATEWAPPATPPLVRLTVLLQDQPLADMRLWQDRLQWSRPGQPDALATLAPADLETLLRLARQAVAARPTPP